MEGRRVSLLQVNQKWIEHLGLKSHQLAKHEAVPFHVGKVLPWSRRNFVSCHFSALMHASISKIDLLSTPPTSVLFLHIMRKYGPERIEQREKFDAARFELYQLLNNPSLAGVPLLVLGNKNDVEGHASAKELIQAL